MHHVSIYNVYIYIHITLSMYKLLQSLNLVALAMCSFVKSLPEHVAQWSNISLLNHFGDS